MDELMENEIFKFTDAKDFSQETINKIFNGLEDLYWLSLNQKENYQNDDDALETFNIYLMDLNKWINENKSHLENVNHDYIEGFLKLNGQMEILDNQLSASIFPSNKMTMYSFLSKFKSEDYFYSTMGNFTFNSSNTDLKFDNIVRSGLKSLRVEHLGRQLTYVLSGQASNDYSLKDLNGLYYKQKMDNLFGTDSHTIMKSGFDGHVDKSKNLNGQKNLILFATSNLKINRQLVWKELNEDNDVIFTTGAFFNPNYDVRESVYNGRKATQHGKDFLNQLEGANLNYHTKTLFNILPFMSLIGKIEIPGKNGRLVTDFAHLNPFVVGNTDTYFLFRKLREIRQLDDEVEKTEKLCHMFLDFSEKITEKLYLLQNDFNCSETTRNILLTTKNVIMGTVRNFNKTNMPNGLPKDVIEKLTNSILIYKHTFDKMSEESLEENYELLGYKDSYFEKIKNSDDLLKEWSEREFNQEVIINLKKDKDPLINDDNWSSLKEIFDASFYPENEVNLYLKLMMSRQRNVEDTFLSQNNIDQILDKYPFNISKEVYSSISISSIDNNQYQDRINQMINFIKETNDFNKLENREKLIQFIDETFKITLNKNITLENPSIEDDFFEILNNIPIKKLKENILTYFNLLKEGNSLNFRETVSNNYYYKYFDHSYYSFFSEDSLYNPNLFKENKKKEYHIFLKSLSEFLRNDVSKNQSYKDFFVGNQIEIEKRIEDFKTKNSITQEKFKVFFSLINTKVNFLYKNDTISSNLISFSENAKNLDKFSEIENIYGIIKDFINNDEVMEIIKKMNSEQATLSLDESEILSKFLIKHSKNLPYHSNMSSQSVSHSLYQKMKNKNLSKIFMDSLNNITYCHKEIVEKNNQKPKTKTKLKM